MAVSWAAQTGENLVVPKVWKMVEYLAVRMAVNWEQLVQLMAGRKAEKKAGQMVVLMVAKRVASKESLRVACSVCCWAVMMVERSVVKWVASTVDLKASNSVDRKVLRSVG